LVVVNNNIAAAACWTMGLSCSVSDDHETDNERTGNITLNPLMRTLQPHTSVPLYSNTVISTLAVDGWYSMGRFTVHDAYCVTL